MILGIDEVGRGPWAGPLVVGAVILGEDFANFQQLDAEPSSKPSSTSPLFHGWQALTDSKKLTAKRRQELSDFVLTHAAATGLGWVSSAELDRYGLSPALKLAARRAVKQVLRQRIPFTEIIIDGTINLLDDTPLTDRVTLLKKADSLVKEVSAAAIIAKVARDQYMADLEQVYPGYGFDRHAGYGTSAHQQALLDLGVCPEHRRSFRPIREILARSAPGPQNSPESHNLPSPSSMPPHPLGRNNTIPGHLAEQKVVDHLMSQGHQILARNFRTKLCEIDVISLAGDQVIFTEVKYHLDRDHGSPLEQITPRKQHQLRRAAEIFLALKPQFSRYQPQLAAASVIGPDFRVEDWFILDAISP